MEAPYNRIYARVDLDCIIKNMKAMAKKLPGNTKLISVVKTDGYGHGAVPVAKAVEGLVWGYATATLEEAALLKTHGIEKPVLILGTVHEQQMEAVINYGIRPTVFELEKAKKLSDLAVQKGKKVLVHIAIDTGMSRIGYLPGEKAANEIAEINSLPGIGIEGLFTHFSRADEADKEVTKAQYQAYHDFAEALEAKGIHIPLKHCSNSAAILDLEDMGMDAVRAGIAMYGIYPSDEVNKKRTPLQPAMEIYSFITYIKEIGEGVPVSYGGSFVAEKPMRIATVGAGYGDGYPRGLSGKGEVIIRGRRAPVLGRICMDQFMVDVTHIPDAAEDDRVTLVGRDGEEFISMEELAEKSGGFRYEIPCLLGKRVPRVYMKGGTMIGKKDYHDDCYKDFL